MSRVWELLNFFSTMENEFCTALCYKNLGVDYTSPREKNGEKLHISWSSADTDNQNSSSGKISTAHSSLYFQPTNCHHFSPCQLTNMSITMGHGF